MSAVPMKMITGTYRYSSGLPPSAASDPVMCGMLPNTISRTIGSAKPQMGQISSRTCSFASVSASRSSGDGRPPERAARMLVVVIANIVQSSSVLVTATGLVTAIDRPAVPAGEGDERVLQAGLLDPQLSRRDAPLCQQRTDR